MRWAGSRHLLHDRRFFTIRKKDRGKSPGIMAGPDTCTGTRPGSRRDTRHLLYPVRYRRYLMVPVSATTAARGSSVRERLFRPRPRSPPLNAGSIHGTPKAPDRSGDPVHRTAHREIHRNYPPRPAPPHPTRAGIFTTRLP